MSQKKEFISCRKAITYLDIFAGAGGFSEGFMQAYTEDKYYDFRLASGINKNCEQWVYGSGNYLYFEGNKLTAIQN